MARVTRLTVAEGEACKEMLSETVTAFNKSIMRIAADTGMASDSKPILAIRRHFGDAVAAIRAEIDDATEYQRKDQ